VTLTMQEPGDRAFARRRRRRWHRQGTCPGLAGQFDGQAEAGGQQARTLAVPGAERAV